MLKTPVLLIVFNRPDLTSLMIKAISEVRPAEIFIAADGPRPHVVEDEILCQQARDIATSLDWPCRMRTLLSPINMGCKLAVQTALDWFFDHVEGGIILEDDCLPSSSFFTFCEKALNVFKDDLRVMAVCGSKYTDEIREDVFFSYYADPWGWATWRRAWRLYDRHMVG